MTMDDDAEIWSDPNIAGRAAGRDSLLLAAKITLLSDPNFSVKARVRNVSETGLMADTPARPLTPGAGVAIDLRGVGTVTGAVVWYQNGRTGIRFDDPINPKAVRRPVSARGGR